MKVHLLFFGLITLLFSCKKEIKVDLNDANPKMVIVANFDATDQYVNVRVSKSGSYFTPYSEELINNAIVTIYGPNNTPFIIPTAGNGIYESAYSEVQIGATYRITVSVDGELFEATSKLMPTLIGTNIYANPFVAGEVGGPNYIISYFYQDYPGVGNYSKVIKTVNGIRKDKFGEFSINSDALTDGNEVALTDIGFFEVGDTVSYEIQSINEKTFDYYTQLQSGTSSSAAAQGNPVYVWSNDALGYFSVFTKSTLTIVLE